MTDKALWEEGEIFDQVQEITQKLGWDNIQDNIVVEVGGMSVSGIDVGEEYNKKWQSPKGTVKYNRDSFIVIKNKSRSPVISSIPNHEETDSNVAPSGNNTNTNDSPGSTSVPGRLRD